MRQQYAVDLEIELCARRILAQLLESRVVPRRAQPAALADDVHFAEAGEHVRFADADELRVWPGRQRETRQREQQAGVMGRHRFRPDAGAAALADLPREAR